MPPLFEEPKAVVGMIHVGALPGTPRNREPLDAIIGRARAEAGVDMRARGVDPLPLGLQILAGVARLRDQP